MTDNSQILEDIEKLDSDISDLVIQRRKLIRKFLTIRGWAFEDDGRDDSMSFTAYIKVDFITTDEDHALEHEMELSDD